MLCVAKWDYWKKMQGGSDDENTSKNRFFSKKAWFFQQHLLSQTVLINTIAIELNYGKLVSGKRRST